MGISSGLVIPTGGFCRNDTDITSAIAKQFETAA
jgi:hypothetical protein